LEFVCSSLMFDPREDAKHLAECYGPVLLGELLVLGRDSFLKQTRTVQREAVSVIHG